MTSALLEMDPLRVPAGARRQRNAAGNVINFKKNWKGGREVFFAGAGQLADSVHPVEKLCSFYHLDIQRHSSERAGTGDRGGLAVGER